MMSQRYTRKTVEAVFATFIDVAKRRGFDTTGWFLVCGGGPASNARNWEHRSTRDLRGEDGTGWCETEFRSFLGLTPREAYDTLSTRIDTLTAVGLMLTETGVAARGAAASS